MSHIDRRIFNESHGKLDLAWNYEAGYLHPYTREVFDAWLDNKDRENRIENALWLTDSANKLAVLLGPMHQLGVCWLQNGIGGTAFPEELIAVGFHIMQSERMPDWLAKIQDAKQAATV